MTEIDWEIWVLFAFPVALLLGALGGLVTLLLK